MLLIQVAAWAHATQVLLLRSGGEASAEVPYRRCGVLIFTVILAGVAVTAHTTSEPEPEWLMVMNAETGEFQHAAETYTLILDGVDEE